MISRDTINRAVRMFDVRHVLPEASVTSEGVRQQRAPQQL